MGARKEFDPAAFDTAAFDLAATNAALQHLRAVQGLAHLRPGGRPHLRHNARDVSPERQISRCNGAAVSKQGDAATNTIIPSDTFRLGVVADQSRPVRQALDFEVVGVEHHLQARQCWRSDENELAMGVLIPNRVSLNYRGVQIELHHTPLGLVEDSRGIEACGKEIPDT